MPINLQKTLPPFPDEMELAVVIAGSLITNDNNQRHVGFLIKHGDGSLWLYDLAWNNWYRKTEINEKYAYLIPDFLDPVNASTIVAFLAMSHHANQGKIPYGIKYEDGAYFDEKTGERIRFGDGTGLTCATFVLEVFNRYGFQLVNKSTWPITEEDAKWQEKILNKLIETAHPEHSIECFLAQFSDVGKVPRFRPEEAVGAASHYTGDPLPFDTVSPLGLEVVDALCRLHLN